MKKIRNSMLAVAITMFVIVGIALTQMKITTTARGVVDIKAHSGFSLIDQENAQSAANESNARTDAGASEEDKGNTSNSGSTSNNTTNGTNSSSTSSVLTNGATSNDISLTSKGNTSVNTTGEMPKTGENDTALFALVGAVVVGAIAFIRAKSVRVK